MTSTSSSATNPQEPQPPLTQDELDEAALREAMERGEGIRRVGRLVGIDSIDRNMNAEDEAFARKMKGTSNSTEPTATEDDMRVLAGGNVYINPTFEQKSQTLAPTTTEPTPASPTTPQQLTTETSKPPATTAVAQPAERRRTRWWPAALVATSLLGGAGAGYIINDLTHPAKDTDTDTISVLDFPAER